MAQKKTPKTSKPAANKPAAKPSAQPKAPARPGPAPKAVPASKYDQSGAPWWKKFRPE